MSQPVLIDADPGNDDAVLLALVAAADSLDIIGVSTVAGNDTLDHTTRNARAILDWFGQTEVPVAPGAKSPLVRKLKTPDIHGLGGLHASPPAPTTEPISMAGANAIIQWAREHPEKPTLLAVGPLTNIALALTLEPRFPDLFADVYVMGGSAIVGGNATPTAEYNFYTDPEAARRVVRDLQPKLVGLDVTNQAIVRSATARKWASGDEPFATIASWLVYAPPKKIEDTLNAGARPASHDAVVGVELLADFLEFEAFPSEVVIQGNCRGALVCDRRGERADSNESPTVEVATGINTDIFEETLVGTLNEIEPSAF